MGYEDAEKPYAIHDELSGGIEWGMKTSEEAVEALESCLVDHRNYAREDGEWASEVESVCGLLVTHVFDREVHTEDDGSYYHEWGIKPTAEWSRITQALNKLEMYENGQADYELVRDQRDELAAELEGCQQQSVKLANDVLRESEKVATLEKSLQQQKEHYERIIANAEPELSAELEQWKTNSSHAMDTANDIYEQKLEVLAELERVKAERDELKRIVNEIWGMFYGHGMDVVGWHLNGDLEPIDNFFEENDWDPESCAAHGGKEGENDEE